MRARELLYIRDYIVNSDLDVSSVVSYLNRRYLFFLIQFIYFSLINVIVNAKVKY